MCIHHPGLLRLEKRWMGQSHRFLESYNGFNWQRTKKIKFTLTSDSNLWLKQEIFTIVEIFSCWLSVLQTQFIWSWTHERKEPEIFQLKTFLISLTDSISPRSMCTCLRTKVKKKKKQVLIRFQNRSKTPGLWFVWIWTRPRRLAVEVSLVGVQEGKINFSLINEKKKKRFQSNHYNSLVEFLEKQYLL